MTPPPVSASRSSRRLADCREGEKIEIAEIRGGLDLRMRLAALGILPGVRSTVLQGTGSGPCILAVGGTRVAVGRGMARCIEVRKS
ncbi:MAG: FeoA family protein [Kiritimatiellia bacterium]|nr:FeoA family protein [Kiritimatiellia bacterium]